MADTAAHAHDAHHAHPTAKTYIQIAVVLFILTALEVLAYDWSHDPASSLYGLVAPIFVPALVVLSIAKFALVGLYYMHLKTDDRLLTWVFNFSLLIAVIVVLGLMVLMSYLFNYGAPPLVK